MVPFEPRHGFVVIPVKIVGPRRSVILRFAVDTGATESIVKRTFAQSLGYDLSTQREKSLLTTNGESVVIEIVAERIEALGEVREQFPMLCAAFPKGIETDGILGLDFFRSRKLVLDFRLGWIAIE